MSEETSIRVLNEQLNTMEKRISILEEMEKSVAASDVEMLRKENEVLRIENKQLKNQSEKDNYRIQHLIRSLEEEETKDQAIAKMQYRINHLIRCLNEAEGMVEPPKPSLIAEADPFWGVQLVVGRIVKAWKHEKADKLICEEIDCGESYGGVRRIASGLFQFYKPEDLIGKCVVVVANLKEKALVGYPSHGMVLCACKEDHSAVEILNPPENAAPGMRVELEGVPVPAVASTLTKEINLRSTSNVWSATQPELRLDGNGEAVYKGVRLCVNGSHLRAASLKEVPLS